MPLCVRFVLVVVAVLCCAAPTARAADARGQILVKLAPGASESRALASADAVRRGHVRRLGTVVAEVPAARVDAALRTLNRRADVEFAERDETALPQESVPDDPYFPQGTYALGGGAWGWFRSHTTEVWDATTGDPGIVVAILDSGLKTAGLGDFDGQVVPGYNVLDGSRDVSTNAGNHGTHVAGVVGLAAGNAKGGAGYCPGCRIMPVQVGTDSGASYSAMASGITWAADNGARVINLSWAGTGASATLEEAVAYARGRGAIVFASAGNGNCDCVTYPSATPGVLGVSGVSSSGGRATNANYGSWVAVAAPQGNMTAWPTLNGAPGYAQVGGTSLAAPAAAGIAALVLSAKPSLTVAQLEQALTSTAKPTSFTVRHGEVDALAALKAVGVTPVQPTGAPVNTTAPRVLRSTAGSYDNVPLTAAPAVGDVLVRGQGAWKGAPGLALSAVKWNRCNGDGSGCVAVGSMPTYTVQSADAGYAIKLVISFRNAVGTVSAASSLTAPVGGGSAPAPAPAPVNTAPPVVSGTTQAGSTLTASTGTWSNSPTAYAYRWQRCDGACVDIAGATAASYAVTSGDVGATLRVLVTASNASGSATAASAATAAVQPAPAATPQRVTSTFTGSLSAKATSMTYQVDAGAGDTHAELSFSTSKCGSFTLTLKDASGAVVATKTGPSVLTLDATVAAGRLSYVVSSSARCGFTLTVTRNA